MPEVGEIVAALQQAAAKLGAAQEAAGQAGVRAEQVQARSAQSGFRGIAQGLGQVRDELRRVQEMQAAVVAQVKAATEIVRQVTVEMSPAQVVATLSPAAKEIGDAATATTAVVGEVEKVKSHIATTLRGGKPGPLTAVADQIKQPLVQVMSHLGDAQRRTDETIRTARDSGNF